MPTNRFERSKEGFHTIGDRREVQVTWEPDGWHWRGVGPGTDQYAGGPFNTSTDAYRAALMMLG